MKIALVIPTRGVIFARTIQSTILNPELPKDSFIFLVAGLPIPDSHNECIRKALATDCTHIFFVEEDIEIPEYGIRNMIAYANEGEKYVAIDYPITDKWRTTVWNENRNILWTGFGCTMIHRSVFENLAKDNWLTDKYEIIIEKMKPIKYRIRERRPSDFNYGYHDIYFGLQLQQMGVKIKVLEGIECKHLRMRTWERKPYNKGTQDIYEI